MSLKAEIETWAAALDLYDDQNFEEALEKFENIADSSKILFNIGLIYATLGEHEVAVENFRAATDLDQYLAVAYFQCGVSHFLLGQYEEAIKNFDDALMYLRGNLTIDYDQLGLKFRLYSCEVLFNKGLGLIYMGLEREGMMDLDEATKEKQTQEHAVIDEAIHDRGEGYTVFSIPVGVLYRPSASKVKNLASKNYLGQAKLVATTDASETFVGFTGAERAAARNGQYTSSAPPVASTGLPPIQRRGTTAARIEGTTTISRQNSVFSSDSRRRPSEAPSATPSARLQRSASAAVAGRPPPRRLASMAETDPEENYPGSRSRQNSDRYENDLVDSYNDRPVVSDRVADWARNNSGSGSFSGSSRGRNTPVRRPTGSSTHDEGYGSSGDYPDTIASFQMMTKIRVKLHHASDTRGMSIDPEMSLKDFRSKVIKKFSLARQVSMKYKDEEGSMVTILDEDDWETAVDTARAYANGRADGKVEIWVDDL